MIRILYMIGFPPTAVRTMTKRLLTLSLVTLLGTGLASAQEQVVNIYSARHYPSDAALYSQFTQSTGIRIQRVDADDAGILARLRAEGAASPADVILLVDAARLWRGEEEGLFQPVKSATLDAAIPAQFRSQPGANGATAWFGFSTRARLIVYDKIKVKKEDVDTYEELGDAKNKGRLCLRSGSHPYNLSLFGAVLEHLGEQKTEAWLKGMVDNMARAPKGGDTDQIRAVAAGECAVAVTNSYYLARLMRSSKPEDQAVVERIGVVFPNQSSWGTHVNIAGGAVARHAKHPANAVKFLEYLASAQAQEHFANGNNEWPVARGVQLDNPALKAMGGTNFKSETIPISVVGKNSVKVQQMLDRAGLR
jgi:iron(III) transport system substrate-binding protein